MVLNRAVDHDYKSAVPILELPGAAIYAGMDRWVSNRLDLWSSDGTQSPPIRIKVLDAAFVDGSVTIGGISYFVTYANDFGAGPAALWRTDGTTAGTWAIEPPPGVVPNGFGQMMSLNGVLHFVMNEAIHGTELWKYSDETKTMQLVQDFYAGFASGSPQQFTQVGDQLFALATTQQYGQEIWVTDLPARQSRDFNDDGRIDRGDYELWRANFAGTTTSALLADGNENAAVDAADYTAWRDAFEQPVTGDYNLDGVASRADLSLLHSNFRQTTGRGLEADGNHNGIVDAADYTTWRDNYVRPTTGDYNRDHFATLADLAFWQTHFNSTIGVALQADGNANAIVDAADYTLWRNALPVPATTTFTVAVASSAVSAIAPIAASPRGGKAIIRHDANNSPR